MRREGEVEKEREFEKHMEEYGENRQDLTL
jgi:hypothetical protein